MSGSAYPVAPVAPAAQPMGGGQPTSALGAAMMGRPANMGLAPISSGMNAPLASMLMAQMGQGAQQGGPSPLAQLTNGVGNLMQGNQYNGMPGQTQMAGLNQQAAQNVAGMVPGAGGYGNGPM